MLSLRACGARLVLCLALGGCADSPASVRLRTDTTTVLPIRGLWKVRGVGDAVAPAVDDSSAFFVGTDHRVVAIDKRTGRIRWTSAQTHTAGPSGGNGLFVVGSLVVYPDYELYAFERRTGTIVWTFRDTATLGAGYFLLAADSTRIFAGSYDGVAYAVSALNGHLAWKSSLATDSQRTVVRFPVVSGGRVAFTYQRTSGLQTGGVALLDAVTGAVRWRTELPPEFAGLTSGGWGRVAFVGDLLVASSADGRIHGLDTATGTIRWSSQRPVGLPATAGDYRSLVSASAVVIASSGEGFLSGLDGGTGTLLWTLSPNRGSVLDLMTERGGTVYLVYLTGQLASIQGGNGIANWSTAIRDADYFLTFPAIDSTMVFVSRDRKSTRLNSSHLRLSRMPSSA